MLCDHRRNRYLGVLGRERHRVGPALFVLCHRRVPLDGLGAPRSISSNPGSASARVISRIRSGRKLRPSTESPGTDAGLSSPTSTRFDELVGLVALVRRLRRRLAAIGMMIGAAMDEQVIRELDPVPPPVPVHRVIAPDDGPDPSRARVGHPPLDGRQITGARSRQRVAPVRERMQHEVGHPELGAEFDQRLDVAPARVDAAVGYEADQVDALGPGERRAQHRVRRELAILDRLIDPGQVLHHDRAGAEVQMAHLGVAHLPLGQPDRAAGRVQLRVRIRRPVARRTPACSPARQHFRLRRARAPSRRG